MSNALGNGNPQQPQLKGKLVEAEETTPQEEEKHKGNWLFWAFFATSCFLVNNGLVSEITKYAGPCTQFYMASGGIFVSIGYWVVKTYQNGGWVNQNIVVDGKFSCSHLIGFFLNCVVYCMINNTCYLAMYFAHQAGINTGIITSIYCIFPLYTALADYLMFRTKLKYYHWAGMITVVVACLLISAQGIIDYQKQEKDQNFIQKCPTWIPVLFGIFSPVIFAMFGIFAKHLCQPSPGFKDSDLAFTTYLVSNTAALLLGICFYWTRVPFDSYCFLLGFISSAFNTVGLAGLTVAYANGPLGPVAAICSICNAGLVFVEAVKAMRWLSGLETIAFVLCIFGSLILVLPEFVEKYFLCCFFQNKLKQKKVEKLIKMSQQDKLQ